VRLVLLGLGAALLAAALIAALAWLWTVDPYAHW